MAWNFGPLNLAVIARVDFPHPALVRRDVLRLVSGRILARAVEGARHQVGDATEGMRAVAGQVRHVAGARLPLAIGRLGLQDLGGGSAVLLPQESGQTVAGAELVVKNSTEVFSATATSL